MLIVECHCRRLICRSIVLCVIIHIHTQLHIKHLGKLELQIQIGVYGKLRQRQYALVRGFLIYHGVAPIECAETEILLQQGLERLLKGRTSFIIAHRLSTIKNADFIMYIDKGGIREKGTHEELLRQKGDYYHLYMSQYDFLAG